MKATPPLLATLLLLLGTGGVMAQSNAPEAAAIAPATPAAAAPAQAAPAQAAPAQLQQPTQANPRGGTGFANVPRDESQVAGDLPSGTVEAVILDGNSQPIANKSVRLGILFQKISEGETRSERLATTDSAGKVRFSELKGGSDFSYRVTLKSGEADYASPPFNLGERGHRVKLHVLPVATRVEDASIGMRGFFYIEPRDDVFQFEVLFRVFNLGAVTWVPKDVIMRLPSGFKAFSAQREMGDAGFAAVDGVGARLEGTFTPGQHDVAFRFQMPKEGHETASFRVGLLPRTAEMRVITEASKDMSLKVDGFEEPRADSNQQGKRVLVTRKVFTQADTLEAFVVDLAGIPVPGPGRWIAVLIASALALTGFAAFRGVVHLDGGDEGVREQDLQRAREILLSEIVEVEKARRSSALGPRAYADARRTLLESLARLGADVLAPPKKSKRRRAAA